MGLRTPLPLFTLGFSLAIATVVAVETVAADSDKRQGMQQEAQSIHQHSTQQGSLTDVFSDPSEAEAALPEDYANPPQKDINAGNIQQQAAQEKARNPLAQELLKHTDKRTAYRKNFNADGWLNNAESARDNPESLLGVIAGQYTDCQTIPGKPITKDVLNSCSTWNQSEIATCRADQVLEIDEDYAYQCRKSRQHTRQQCTSTLSIWCPNLGTDCDAGGITRGSVQSDMRWTYQYPVLTLGTICDNCWHGDCTFYDRRTTFHIQDVDLITDFTLTEVGFDDFMLIKVNGHLVYNGPYGGTKLELKRGYKGWWFTDIGTGQLHSCEQGRDWRFYPHINLRPYLRNGMNEIFTRVNVSDRGEGWMKIRARQKCQCPQWQEAWTEVCQ